MEVSDSSSHRRDQIANFAEVLRNAPAKQKVFEAVYYGKKKVKTVKEISITTGYKSKRVTEIAKPLARGEKLFEQGRMKTKQGMVTIYKKIDFVVTNKKKILTLARNSKRFDKYFTKTNSKGESKSMQTIILKVPFKAETIYVQLEQMEEFSRVKDVILKSSSAQDRLPEVAVKTGIIKLLGEAHVPKDWGGENNDIFSTKLTLFNKKRRVAFALKGPAKSGPLVPKMMGKNGDQIQRLFSAPAEVFIVQYEGEVKESIFTLMEQLAKAKAVSGGPVYWGVIDNEGTKKIRVAYPKAFKK